MSQKFDLYNSAYGNLAADVLTEIRSETYGTDLGQSSWTTVEEYEHFCEWLNIDSSKSVLETASGSGGPALHIAKKYGCAVTGIDINEEGIKTANQNADANGVSNAEFQLVDVSGRLPFEDASFDATICIDAANHFPDRLHVLREWSRLLRSGGRLLFTDPVVITGAVTFQELADRSSIGVFVFMPPETTEQFVADAGLKLIRREDVTENAAMTSSRWHDAREKRRERLIEIEGESRFNGLQQFLAAVHKLTRERRLSRYAFLAEK
jgi:cyclopropane fatty-acyl-phospholipid synthase-like methyltransferase